MVVLYNGRKLLGWSILAQLYGSVVPRCMPYAIISAAVSYLSHLEFGGGLREDAQLFDHPYAHHIFGIVVGFTLVFRTNIAYGRFWEGRTMMQQMSSKYSDLVIQAITFDELCEGKPAPPGQAQAPEETMKAFQDRISHLASLLHALVLMECRQDTDLTHIRSRPLLRRYSGGRTPPGPPGSPSPRLNRASSREWVEEAFLVQKKSLQARESLQLEVLGGITEGELRSLERVAVNVRPQVALAWTHRALVSRIKEGGLCISPPILSRTFQVLSNGTMFGSNCIKVADTPFPFPYNQLVQTALMVFMFSSPIAITEYAQHQALAVVLSIITTLSYFGLHEIARELEEPFGPHPNDLSIMDQQKQFNRKIMVVTNPDERDRHFLVNQEPSHSAIASMGSMGSTGVIDTTELLTGEKKSRGVTFSRRQSKDSSSASLSGVVESDPSRVTPDSPELVGQL